MSGTSPTRRPKTADLTAFFRGSGHSSNQTRQQDATSSMNLEVPSGDEGASGPATKKKITRIPLFGRSRKKSNQSAASSPFASSNLVRDSSDLGEPSSRGPSPARRPSEPSIISVQAPQLPVHSKVPTSLTSKFAAHFSHSRSSKVLETPQTELMPTQPVVRSSGLVPPSNRSASFESGSSGGTKTRSTTPRPTRPTIMVSLSADNNDEFKDLFTRPTDNPSSGSSRSPPPSPKTRSPETSIYRRGHTPASAIAAAVRDRHNSDIGRPSSTSSKNSKTSSSRKNSDERNSGSSTPRLSEARESPRLVPPDKEKGLPPSLQRKASVATGSGQTSESSSSSAKSRMKQPSTQTRSRPPSTALPLPPSSPLPSTPPPLSPPPSSPLPIAPSDYPSASTSQHNKTESGSSQKMYVRPRAHTISSTVNAPAPLSPLSQSFTTSPIAPTFNSAFPTTDGEILDIDNASAMELRKALKNRNQQYDELASSVLKMTEAHVTVVTTLEKKIAALEKEARKRETQIKGFTWLLNDGEAPQQPKALPPGTLSQSRFASRTNAGAESLSDHDAYRTRPPGAPRRLAYQSDSGAESHATSGAESLRASGASGTESMTSIFRNKKLRRPYPVGDSPQSLPRTGSLLRSSKIPPSAYSEKALPDTPYQSNPKRSSMSSMSPSPSSSTSSLLPPSPSITMSSLSAIPEGSGPTGSLLLPRHESSEQQEDRRAIRQSHRTSASSLTSSSTAASSSYSANMKRSRPPSIAQVLEKSPNLGDVLEKLRPFS